MSYEILSQHEVVAQLADLRIAGITDPVTAAHAEIAVVFSHEALRADRDRLAARAADLEAALHVASGRVRWLHRVAAVDWAPDEKAALVRDLNLIDAALAAGGES